MKTLKTPVIACSAALFGLYLSGCASITTRQVARDVFARHIAELDRIIEKQSCVLGVEYSKGNNAIMYSIN
ncbi:hypothetical protein, partial [Deferrisoma palaeochoriense]